MKYFFVAIYLFSSACSKSNEQSNTNTNAETLSNVSYGSDSKQKLDIYLPANRSSATTKVVVLIHGGGWSAGDKSDFSPFVLELQKRFPDYAIANINYRLFSGASNLFPTQENDTKAAIEFLLAKSDEYKISTNFALIGASAGAHLALLQSYKHNSGKQIKTVISLFGPTELVSLYDNPPSADIKLLLSTIIGGTPQSMPSIYQSSSPYNFVTASAPATLLFHGGLDPLVPASQSVLLKDKLQLSGISNEYVFYPTEGHGWAGSNLLDTFNKIQNFLNNQFK